MQTYIKIRVTLDIPAPQWTSTDPFLRSIMIDKIKKYFLQWFDKTVRNRFLYFIILYRLREILYV